MKKLVFLLAIVVLAGGAWYMQKTSVGGDSFSRAMEIMKNLKSSALTTNEINILENAYQATLTRIPLLEGFIENDEAELNTFIGSINKAGLTAIKATIVSKAKLNRNANLDSEIDTLISSLGLTSDQVTKIKTIASRLNRVSRELGLREQYVDATGTLYGFIRSGLCAENSPQAYDLYTAGTVSPRFVSSTKSPTFVAKADACGTGANVDKITEYKCVEGQFRTDSTENYKKTTTCTYGCKTGVCLKGEINPATITSDAAGTTVLGDVKADQPFYLKINANRAADTTTPLTVEVTSTAFNSPAKCTLTTKNTTFSTVGQTMVLGPVVCTANATFNFSLKEGGTGGVEIDTASTPVSIGANGMKELVVVPPSTTATTPITIGAITPFTVRAMGTNGYPYNKFTSPVVLIVTGDSAAVNLDNKVIGTTAGGDTEKVFNITFSQAGTFTIEARGGTYVSTPITVTVTAPKVTATATATLNGTQLVPTITNGGSGYTVAPDISISPGDACTTIATAGANPSMATATITGGVVTAITIANQTTCTSAPTFIIAPPQ